MMRYLVETKEREARMTKAKEENEMKWKMKKKQNKKQKIKPKMNGDKENNRRIGNLR